MAPPRRLALLALAVFGIAVGVAVPRAIGGSNLADRQAEIVAELADLRATVAAAKRREKVLTSDIDAAGDQIDLVGDQLSQEQGRLLELSGDLEASEARLAELRDEVREVTGLLELQRRQERVAQRRLESRLVELYKSEPTDAVTEILLRVGDLGQVLNELEYLDRVAENDEDIVVDVHAAKRDTVELRRRTVRLQRDVAQATAALADQTERQRQLRDGVASREQELLVAQEDRRGLLDRVASGREDAQGDIEDLEEASRSLARKIAALAVARSSGVTTGGGARPSSGFVWPVSGPITSGFGWRWGRMHEGIDVGVGFGTAIHAVAAGTVVHTGWLGGYGNLVVVDHGDGLATAYAHQQAIHVATGQSVAQGDVLGEVGSTGNSTGPHLHFEVRINGSAVDPLGYL